MLVWLYLLEVTNTVNPSSIPGSTLNKIVLTLTLTLTLPLTLILIPTLTLALTLTLPVTLTLTLIDPRIDAKKLF